MATAAVSSDAAYAEAASDPHPAATSAPPVTTQAQIANWISSEEISEDGPQGYGPGDASGPAPRAVHGEFGASIGTGGYRNVYGVADIPVGQTGDLGLAVSNTAYNGRHGYGGGQSTSLGVSLRLGDPSGAPTPQCGMARSVWLPTDDRAALSCAGAAAR